MSNVYPDISYIQTLHDIFGDSINEIQSKYANWYVAPVMYSPNTATILSEANFDAMENILNTSSINFKVVKVKSSDATHLYFIAEPTNIAKSLLEDTLGLLKETSILSEGIYKMYQSEEIKTFWKLLDIDQRRVYLMEDVEELSDDAIMDLVIGDPEINIDILYSLIK